MNSIREKIEAKLYTPAYKRMVAKNKIPDQRTSLVRLKELGFSPSLIFDVGAYQGDFTSMCSNIWPHTGIYAFEGLHEKIDLLRNEFNNQKIQIVETLIGEEDETCVNFYADETASSVLHSEEGNTVKKIVKQRMMRLDSFVRSSNIPAPNLLKIDTQGYEYQILKGCGSLLNTIEVILLELNFLEIYDNVKLAHEVIAFLSTHNFVIYDICEIHRRPLDHALVQVDFLFVKQNSYLREDKRWGKNK